MHDVHTMKLGRWPPPWWGVGAVPAPPGHRCDQTGLPVRPQGATFTGQPAGCSRYTAVTLNKPLDFERGGQFFNHGKLLLRTFIPYEYSSAPYSCTVLRTRTAPYSSIFQLAESSAACWQIFSDSQIELSFEIFNVQSVLAVCWVKPAVANRAGANGRPHDTSPSLLQCSPYGSSTKVSFQ